MEFFCSPHFFFEKFRFITSSINGEYQVFSLFPLIKSSPLKMPTYSEVP